MANKNIRALSYRKGLDNNLFENISVLSGKTANQEEFHELAKKFMIDDSVLFATRSFYDFLKPENIKKRALICNGTACMVANTQSALTDMLKNYFNADEIGHVACVGRCHTNSAFMLKNKTYSTTSQADVNNIVNKDGHQKNLYNIGCNTLPILTSKIENISNLYKKLDRDKPKNIIQELKLSNLRGRGGAGFPFWFKLDAVNKEKDIQKYIVCNADEGDPGAFSDMYLMEYQPHKVLFGMIAAGFCVGANAGVLYIRGEYPDSISKMSEAIAELQQMDILNGFKFKIIQGQGSYVCGEETALLNSIEGLRPEVRVRPPYPAQYGLFGKPTVLSNVETFANIFWILKNGGNAFSQLGTIKSSGTKLVSLNSFFNRPGLYEIEMGTPLQEIFNEYGMGFKKSVKAVQIGGPLGGIVPLHKIKDLTLDFESFNKNGFLLGHASVVSIPDDFPMIKYLEHLLKFTADESCGKCYPCRIGARRGYEMIKSAQTDSYKIDKRLFDDLIETLEIGSLCALGGGVPLPVKNTLQYFEGELKGYFK